MIGGEGREVHKVLEMDGRKAACEGIRKKETQT